MIKMRTFGLAIGLAFAASSFAFAQQGNPAVNAAASGGSGTHQTAQRTGSAANTQKVIGNHQGYRGLAYRTGRMHHRGGIYAFAPPAHKCRLMHREAWPHAKNCRY
jgi:hypothetical protein